MKLFKAFITLNAIFFALLPFQIHSREIDLSHHGLHQNDGLGPKAIGLDYDEDAGMTFGRGYDSLSDTIKGDCIQDSAPLTPDGSEAQKVSFTIHHITNSVELLKKLNLNAAVSVKSGWGKGSAKTEFASQYSLSTYSVYVMAKVLVLNIMKTIRHPELTEQARKLFLASPKRFRQTCGDEYIGTISSGGEFYAVIEIQTKTEIEKTNVLARLKAKVGTVSGSADFTSSLSSIIKDYNAKIAVFQVGGKIPETGIPTTPELIIEHAKHFPKTVVGKDAMPISVTTYPYSSLPDLPLEVEPIATEMQEEIIKRMIDYQNAYLTHMANIDYILHHQDQFVDPNVDELNKFKQDLLKQTNKVMNVAKRCFADLTQCKFPEDLEYPAQPLPERLKGLSYKDLCEFKRHKTCGDQDYKMEESAHCGVKEYKSGRGEVCGVELYKLARSASCGVIRYNERQDPNCGKVWDYVEQAYDPGYRNCWVGRENVSIAKSTELNLWDRFFPVADWDCPRGQRYEWQSICQNRHSGHWYIICRAQVDAICRKPEFGVELAEQCRHPDHGVESYLPCRDKSFGVESYLSCRHEKHGIETYKSCYAPIEESTENGEFKCSQDPKDYK